MSTETPRETPIVFALPVEDSDEEDGDSADSVQGFKFGASLLTHKISTEDSSRKFSHKFVKMEPDKEVFKDLKENDELYSVNDLEVTSWNHDLLVETLQTWCREMKLVFYGERITFTGEEEEITKGYITLTFTLCGLDYDSKGIIDDCKSWIQDITWTFSMKTETINVSNMSYNDSKELRIRHGPTQQFLMVDKNKVVIKKLGDSSSAERFKVFSYWIMEKLTDKSDGKEREFPKFMLALQSVKTGKFVMCSKGSKKLSLVKDEDINPEMSDVQPNAPFLFLQWTAKDGRSCFFESLAYPDNFMAFNPVRLLRMEPMDPPPFSDEFKETDFIRRNFTFEMM